MITSVEKMIEQYVSSWNNEGLEKFKTEFAKCWAADATYTDPNFDIKGIDSIAALAQGSVEKYPGRTFDIQVAPQQHHGSALYTWGANFPGQPSNQGVDYIEFNDDFKITRLVSFFKPL